MSETLEITALAHGGDGIGRVEGQVCFVPFALPGDTVRARIVRRAKGVLWAEMEEVIAPSPDRLPGVQPTGHAMWLHFAYPAQAVWKQKLVRDLLARIGRIEAEPDWAEDAPLRLGYRTRAEFHGDGREFGFFERGTHHIAATASCPLNHPRLDEALARLRPLGLDGAFTVTVNPEGDDTLVWARAAPAALREAFPQTNTPRDPDRHAFEFDGAPVVNGAFAQASLLLNRLLTRLVVEFVGAADSLFDAYCGSGNLSLPLAGTMRVTGMDHHRPAIEAAAATGAGDYRPGGETNMARAIAGQPWGVVLLDPPRQGAKALTPALCRSEAGAIVYVSCDPATFARDAAALHAAGWRIARLCAVDLFPHTPHIETVCRFVR
jgi:23S rRNA (uracil1939-C5)-methyltransferase